MWGNGLCVLGIVKDRIEERKSLTKMTRAIVKLKKKEFLLNFCDFNTDVLMCGKGLGILGIARNRIEEMSNKDNKENSKVKRELLLNIYDFETDVL